MYADDTTTYFNLEDFDPDNVINQINNELEKITKWLQINKLLNTQKKLSWLFAILSWSSTENKNTLKN